MGKSAVTDKMLFTLVPILRMGVLERPIKVVPVLGHCVESFAWAQKKLRSDQCPHPKTRFEHKINRAQE